MQSVNSNKHTQPESPNEKLHTHKNHDKHAGHNPGVFRDKFWFSMILTMPVVYWSEHIQMLFGYQASKLLSSVWIPAVLGTVIFLYGE